MPATKVTIEKAERLIAAIELADSILKQDNEHNHNTIQSKWNHSIYVKNLVKASIRKNNLNSASLKSLIDSFLVSWNESIGIKTEIFWQKIRELGYDYKRIEPLRFALSKGRFRNVHEGIEAKNNWIPLKDSGLLKDQFSKSEIQRIDEIIENDTCKRLFLLKRVLGKGKLAYSNYLVFGDSWAYFKECNLFSENFNKDEVDILYKILLNPKNKV